MRFFPSDTGKKATLRGALQNGHIPCIAWEKSHLARGRRLGLTNWCALGPEGCEAILFFQACYVCKEWFFGQGGACASCLCLGCCWRRLGITGLGAAHRRPRWGWLCWPLLLSAQHKENPSLENKTSGHPQNCVVCTMPWALSFSHRPPRLASA